MFGPDRICTAVLARRVARAIPLLIVMIGGCGRMEWNWDWAWWKSPRRVVSPTRPDQANAERKSAEPSPARTAPPEHPVAVSNQRAADELIRNRQENRPFYQLYLISIDDPDGVPRGEQRIRLRQARARPCAMVLEMLCIPLGRSGNPDDCYLLYEDRGEFEAAVQLVGSMDVPVLSKPVSTSGPDEAFRAGLGLTYGILERGPIIEMPLIDAAEKQLAEALQAGQLPLPERWAAGIIAGRLMTEYRYDYAAARSYVTQAERLATADSLEQLTAMFWRADALAHDGKSSDAALVYQKIVESYGPRVINSQLVQQSKAGVREKRNR